MLNRVFGRMITSGALVLLLAAPAAAQRTAVHDGFWISFGFGAGLGFDIQLARNFFLTPALDFVYTGTEGDGASLLLFTVGATWH